MNSISENSCLCCQNVVRSFDEAGVSVDVLRGINLDIQTGERIAIVGTSGSGKSTLLNLLSGLDKPTSGEVFLAGKPLSSLSEDRLARLRNEHMGFVFQFHHLLGEFSALENVAIPLLMRKQSIADVTEAAIEVLTRVGLAHRLHHRPSQLSGGERQRVAIARALVSKPKIVLMDEPTGNLDQHTGQEVQKLILELNQELQIAFVIVTHDMTLAKSLDRVLYLSEGGLAEG